MEPIRASGARGSSRRVECILVLAYYMYDGCEEERESEREQSPHSASPTDHEPIWTLWMVSVSATPFLCGKQ